MFSCSLPARRQRPGRAALSAVIPSLRRVLVAASGLLVALPPGAVWAQAGAETVVVTGTREPLPLSRLAADVVVIDAETIARSTADSLADLLRREAGLQLSRSGGPGQATGVFLRGAAAVNTVVLVDGVRVGSATLGSVALETLDLAQVERVEVLRGPGSSLYGADAVGGVVQIFTRRGTAGSQFDAQFGAGGYGLREASASLRGRHGIVDAALTLSHEESSGVSALRAGDAFGNHNPDKDGHELQSAQLQLGVTPLPGQRLGLTVLRSRLDAQYDASEYLPPSYAQDNTADFRNLGRTTVTALDWRGRLGAAVNGSVRLAESEDELDSGGRERSLYRTLRRQASAQLAWDSGAPGQVVLALERVQERVQASSYTGPSERTQRALVLALTGASEALSWQADLRRDDDSGFGGVTTARLGGGLQLAPGWRVRVLAGTTFRAPSFNDLVYPGYGVATLQPERGRSVEAGLQWRQGTRSLDATVYRNQVRDLIGYEADRSFCPADPAYDFGCARNINRARLQGLTLALGDELALAGGTLALKASLDVLDAKDTGTGQRLARRAAHQAHLAADWQRGPWQAGLAVLRLGARPEGTRTLAAETTLDLRAAWAFAPGWQLQAKLVNATDEDLEPARDYQGLGRHALLSLRYQARW
jgi:vitamin B12 transporter